MTNQENQPEVVQKLLGVRELSESLGISHSQCYVWARNGTLPTTKIGKRVRFLPSAINSWLQAGGTAQRATKD